MHWSGTSNLLWKTAVPGVGHASPVVWGERLFLVSALSEAQERVLCCYDVADGRERWRKVVLKAPLEGKHRLNSHASSTPATDGHRVYAAFLDRNEMFVTAYDMEGTEQWTARPGVFSSMHGFCSSPVLFENLVIVNGDHDGDSYLAALDRATGRVVWKTPRPNKTRSYCVPTVFEVGGRTQMVLSGDKSVASYNPRDGSRWWYLPGPTDQFVASVVYNPGANLFFVTGGYPELHIITLRPDHEGEVSPTNLVWRSTKGVSYVPSPISIGPYFLIVSDAGIGCCFEARTGRLFWQERLSPGHHASLVSAGGLVYFLGDDGRTVVVRPGPSYEVVARNQLDDAFFASPAISNGRIYLRGERTLYCVGR